MNRKSAEIFCEGEMLLYNVIEAFFKEGKRKSLSFRRDSFIDIRLLLLCLNLERDYYEEKIYEPCKVMIR